MANQADTIDSETWKDIPGWDGYQASSFGRIRSMDRTRVQRMRDGSMQPVLYPGRIRKQSLCPCTGYMKVGLAQPGGIRRTWCVNVLVCIAFHGPRPDGHDAAHENGDRKDNRASNLRWATRRDNLADRERHGTVNRGERNGMSKLSDADMWHIINRREAGEMVKDLAVEFGIRRSHLSSRLTGYKRRK